MSEIFASVDVGSQKIAVLIAEEQDGKIEVFGHAIGASSGVKYATIIDVDKVAKAISAVVKVAINRCNTKIHNVIINLSDLQLSSTNQEREIPVSGDKITETDVLLVIKNASAVPIPKNKQVLNTALNHFTIDHDLSAVKRPIGLAATVLGAQIHVEIVTDQAMSNLHHSVEKSGLGIDNVVLNSIASAAACVNQDDKNNGICLLDIGAGVSHISVFTGGGTTYSRIFKLGGDSVTENIMQAFGASFDEAERLKIEHGLAQLSGAPEDKLLRFKQANSPDNRYLSSHDLIAVIEQSYRDIFAAIKRDLKTRKLDRALKSGVLLTGGGSLIVGCEQLGVAVFRLRAKLARVDAHKITAEQSILTNPIYMSALGLLIYDENDADLGAPQEKQASDLMGKIKRLFEL